MTIEELFPHAGFPVRLEYTDVKERKICWFQCENHLQKHLTRYKLDEKKVTIYRNDGAEQFTFNGESSATTDSKPERKSTKRISKPKTNTRKNRTAKTDSEPKKRGRPRKVKTD